MLINYQHVDINQQEHTVLSDVNFQLNEGEFIKLYLPVYTNHRLSLKYKLLLLFLQNY